MKALSIRQPWADLIVLGHKDVENRTWLTRYRGPLLIHASMTFDHGCKGVVNRAWSQEGRYRYGGIVGIADLVDCVTESDSEWFTGPYGFVLENARPLPFKLVKGRLGLFEVEWPEVTEG